MQKLCFFAGWFLPLVCLCCLPIFHTWPGRRFLLFYFAPIVSMVFFWGGLRVEKWQSFVRGQLAIDAAILTAALARFVIGEVLPFSGHMLFFVYTLLTTREKWYRVLCILLILETTWFKLHLWNDWRTWTMGSVAGLISGVAWMMVWKRKSAIS
jgi:cation transport ATPase